MKFEESNLYKLMEAGIVDGDIKNPPKSHRCFNSKYILLRITDKSTYSILCGLTDIPSNMHVREDECVLSNDTNTINFYSRDERNAIERSISVSKLLDLTSNNKVKLENLWLSILHHRDNPYVTNMLDAMNTYGLSREFGLMMLSLALIKYNKYLKEKLLELVKISAASPELKNIKWDYQGEA